MQHKTESQSWDWSPLKQYDPFTSCVTGYWGSEWNWKTESNCFVMVTTEIRFAWWERSLSCICHDLWPIKIACNSVYSEDLTRIKFHKSCGTCVGLKVLLKILWCIWAVIQKKCRLFRPSQQCYLVIKVLTKTEYWIVLLNCSVLSSRGSCNSYLLNLYTQKFCMSQDKDLIYF